jgi:hypothetical protein
VRYQLLILLQESGTGGTISVLPTQERNQISKWGIDTYGSVFKKKYHETEFLTRMKFIRI